MKKALKILLIAVGSVTLLLIGFLMAIAAAAAGEEWDENYDYL